MQDNLSWQKSVKVLRMILYFLHLPIPDREVIHHDWEGWFHAKPWHNSLCHLVALQVDQWTQREDRSALLGPDFCSGSVGERRKSERPVVRSGYRQPARWPVPRCLPLWRPYLWHAGESKTHFTLKQVTWPFFFFFELLWWFKFKNYPEHKVYRLESVYFKTCKNFMTRSCRAICSPGLNICTSGITDIEQGLVFATKCENIQCKQKSTSFLKKKKRKERSVKHFFLHSLL